MARHDTCFVDYGWGQWRADAYMRKQWRISPLFLLLVALGFVTLLRGSALFHQRPIRKSLIRAEIANIRDQFYDEAPG